MPTLTRTRAGGEPTPDDEPPRTDGVHVTLEELLALRPPSARRERRTAAHPVHGVASGESRSRARGRGIEFDEVRPYQGGDDIRAIDWRASARRGRPFTKLFAEERERTRFVAVDQRATMFFGSGRTFKSVIAARAAASACWSALARGERVGGLVAGERVVTVRPRRARHAALRLLDAVATANRALSARAPPGVTLERLLDDCLAHAGTGSAIVLLGDFVDYEPRLAPTLGALGRRHTLSLVQIGDPLEETLDIGGTFGIGDGERRRTLRIGRARRARYVADRAARLRRLADDAAACGATLVRLSTDDAAVDALDGARRA